MKNEEKETSLTNNQNSNQASSKFSLKSSILKPSQLGSGSNAVPSKPNKIFQPFSLKPSVLCPPILSVNSNTSATNNTDDEKSEAASTTNTNDTKMLSNDNKFPKLNIVNPFNRIQDIEGVTEDNGNKNVEATGDENAIPVKVGSGSSTSDTKVNDTEEDPITKLTRNGGIPKSCLFSSVKSTIVESSTFVFGQNVHERVTGSENIKKDADENATGTVTPTTTSSSSTNSATATNIATNHSNSDLLFSSGLTESDDTTNSEILVKDPSSTDCNKNRSLIEAARIYEESRAQKRKYDEVETITGEEDEINKLEINCKLFAFIASNWEERGRGALRLNDFKNSDSESRVVFRTSGALRVLINTKVSTLW